MKSIYRKITDPELIKDGVLFEQAFLNEGEPVPAGWTTDKNSLDLTEPETVPSDIELIKQENADLRQRLELSDEAMLEIADTVFRLEARLDEKGGE